MTQQDELAQAEPLADDGLLELFRTMLTIRRTEELCERMFRDAQIRGALHLCIGQEAVATGVCAAMAPMDGLSFTYRSHGWAIARGISPFELLSECLGKVTGCARGRGGSKHLGDWARKILPSNAIVGAGVPLAVGLALAAKMQMSGDVAVAVFGDGATNQGVVHESMVLAAAFQLPVVFVCEDNGWAEMTPSSVMLSSAGVSGRAAGHNMRVMQCNGMDVVAVREVATEALAHARRGDGPVFVAVDTGRLCGHMTGDTQSYRPQEEIAVQVERDPVATTEALLRATFGDARLDELKAMVDAEIAAALADAQTAPLPDPSSIFDGAPSWTVNAQ